MMIADDSKEGVFKKAESKFYLMKFVERHVERGRSP